MAYNPNAVARLKHVAQLAQVVKSNLDALDGKSFKSAAIVGNKLNFYTSDDKSGTPADSIDIPEELFLDQTGTTLVDNFSWAALSYPNSTNPNLNGKTVLVLAVKGDAQTPTVKYSFVDLSKLIDTYTAADTSINISGHSISVNISATNGNALSLVNDGLLVDISGKVDKVPNAAQGEIAIFGLSGAIAASGLSLADIQAGGSSYAVATSLESGLMSASDKQKLDTFNLADDADVYDMLTGVFGASSASAVYPTESASSLNGGLMSAADKIKLDSIKFASDSSVIVMLNGVFGAGSISSIERA